MTESKAKTRTTGTPRERAIESYDADRKRGARGRHNAGSIGDNPLVALGGGLALGAIIAAVLPTTRRERDLVGPYADRLKDRANDAIGAARDAGVSRLGELGLTKDAGRDVIRQIFEGTKDAARTSAKAAAGTVKGK